MQLLADEIPLPRHRSVVLVVDLVESVSLMQADELGFVQRWQAFLNQVTRLILPASKGRLVKSLGDGLMVEFGSSADAATAAMAMHRWMANHCQPFASGERFLLRAAFHSTDVYVDDVDIYGAGVNLAARVATLAGPGETIVTAAARDGMTDGVDARITDLGKCFLKHVSEPVHVYRIGEMGEAPVLYPERDYAAGLRPTVAVIPFSMRAGDELHRAVGDLIADGVIASLSRHHDVSVVARLSSAVLRDRSPASIDLKLILGADYVLSGSYVVNAERLMLTAETTDVARNRIIWSERLAGPISDLMQPVSEIVSDVASAFLLAVISKEAERVASHPLPTLESYTLLLGGINLMHQSSRQAFDRSRVALDSVLDRHRRAALPFAWLAKWHVMRVLRGISENARADGDLALDLSKRALSLQPESSLCMAVEAFVYTHLIGDLGQAEALLARAGQIDPSEPYGWLFQSVLSSFQGRNAESVAQALRAQALSPRDPMRYFFDTILAAAYLANDEHEAAIQWGLESLRLNSSHSPTLRVLITACFELGRVEESRSYFDRLIREEPDLTLARYRASPNRNSRVRLRCADALQFMGLRPE